MIDKGELHSSNAATAPSLRTTKARARSISLWAQRLDEHAPFDNGPEAILAAFQHLGYVQIDTINVIERSHHHILYASISRYRREHLRHAQGFHKTDTGRATWSADDDADDCASRAAVGSAYEP